MNYKKLYESIIRKARDENRKKHKGGVYYEWHHVIPVFMFLIRKKSRKGPPGHLLGNHDDAENLVLLTPREHFICHILLKNMFKDTKYAIQATSALGFFTSKVIKKHPRYKFFEKANSSLYERARIEGLAAISKCRKGKFPMRDVSTGNIVGSYEATHPKYLSGEWVHHSKGRKWTKNERINHGEQSRGETNNNYRDEALYSKYYLSAALEAKNEFGIVLLKNFLFHMNKIAASNKLKKISSQFVKRKFQNFENLITTINTKNGTNFGIAKQAKVKERNKK